jgi:acetyltransferase
MTDVPGIAEKVAEKIKDSKKPILCNFAGGSRIAVGEEILNKYGIPNYSSAERAVASMNALCNYYTIKNHKRGEPSEIKADRNYARSFIESASENKRRMHGLESMDILKAYDIPVVDARIAKTLPDAVKAAEDMGYPIVMKILSPDISHKSDVGGIRLNLKHADDVERAYNSMMSDVRHYMPDATITGVQLQKMISGGKEVIIGMDRDPQFGPLLMFGLGGTYVEFLKDVSFAVAPITEAEAKHMVSSIKTYPLIAGVRGEAASDIDSIVRTLLKVSQLVTDFPEILEFEINPLMVMPEGQGCVAMDIRFTLNLNE